MQFETMSPPLAKTVRVLLVDPSEDNQLLMKEYLLDTPYAVEIAGHVAAGFDRIQLLKYDLVLIDIQTPAADGLTTICNIRHWERQNERAKRPIIAFTANAHDADMSIEAGCTVHLPKPLNKQMLLQTLNRCHVGPPASELARASVVEVPPAIKSLVPRYLGSRHKDIAALRSALEQRDFGVIARVGHNLKGTGTPYGFPEITEIGRSLERAGKESDPAGALRHVERLEHYLDCVALPN